MAAGRGPPCPGLSPPGQPSPLGATQRFLQRPRRALPSCEPARHCSGRASRAACILGGRRRLDRLSRSRGSLLTGTRSGIRGWGQRLVGARARAGPELSHTNLPLWPRRKKHPGPFHGQLLLSLRGQWSQSHGSCCPSRCHVCRVLTKATGKPQRWIHSPPSHSLWLLSFLFFGGLSSFREHCLLPIPHTHAHAHTRAHMHSHSCARPDMPSSHHRPGPHLSRLWAVLQAALEPQEGWSFPELHQLLDPACDKPPQRFPASAEWQELGRAGGGAVGQEAGHAAPSPV